jgi:hypothetical protein
MRRWLESSATVAVATSDGTSAPRMAPAVAVMAVGPPPSGGFGEMGRWCGGEGAMAAWFSFLAKACGLLFIVGKVVAACGALTQDTLISKP